MLVLYSSIMTKTYGIRLDDEDEARFQKIKTDLDKLTELKVTDANVLQALVRMGMNQYEKKGKL